MVLIALVAPRVRRLALALAGCALLAACATSVRSPDDVRTEAAAGVVESPQPATATKVCSYSSPEGPRTRTVPESEECPKPPTPN